MAEKVELLKWKSVKEELPDADVLVLLYAPEWTEPVWPGYMEEAGKFNFASDENAVGVTHWAEMPAGPNSSETTDQKCNETLVELCEQNLVCIDRVIWIAGQVGCQSDDFEEFIDDQPELVEQFFGADPDEGPEGVFEVAHEAGKLGFLVQLSTPVPKAFKPNGRIIYHAGMRALKWFYVESLPDITKEFEAFQSEVVEKERARSSE